MKTPAGLGDALLDSASDAFATDREGRIIVLESGAERMFGSPPPRPTANRST